jgi:hypothetical protein
MNTFLVYVGIGILALGVAFGLGLLYALPIKLLWNWLMPMIFGLPKLTFWQSWGLLVFCHLLFPTNSSSSKD